MRNLFTAFASACLIALAFDGLATANSYDITINNPTTNTQYSSKAGIVAGGEWGQGVFDTTPKAMRIRSYDIDGTSVADESLASSFDSGKMSGNDWSGTVDAPAGSPSEQINSFELEAVLMGNGSSVLGGTKTKTLKVKGPVGS